MKKLFLLTVLNILIFPLNAEVYKNYDAEGNLVGLSSTMIAPLDPSLITEKYLFVPKDKSSPLLHLSFRKEDIMQINGTYIFNENSEAGKFYKNVDFNFYKILSIDEQVNEKGRIVKSVLVPESVKIRKTNYDETKPLLTYKPYAVIIKYTLLNKNQKEVKSWKEKSSMQYLKLAECNSNVSKYRISAQKKINDLFYAKTLLVKPKIEVFCSKIDKNIN